MSSSQVDRMSAVILAKSIASNRSLLDMKHETTGYVRRLYKYRLFTIGEIAEFAGLSEYRVKQAVAGEEEFRAKSGVYRRHLDHLIRMIGSPDFAKLHIKALVDDGATISGIARVSGLSETSLRRWLK